MLARCWRLIWPVLRGTHLGQMIEGVQYRSAAESRVITAEHASDWGTSGTRLVDRGRLVAALDRAVARKVTIVSAPPGSGKKTSLLRARGHCRVWQPVASSRCRATSEMSSCSVYAAESIRYTLDRSQAESRSPPRRGSTAKR